jgi:hypothetical protein
MFLFENEIAYLPLSKVDCQKYSTSSHGAFLVTAGKNILE